MSKISHDQQWLTDEGLLAFAGLNVVARPNCRCMSVVPAETRAAREPIVDIVGHGDGIYPVYTPARAVSRRTGAGLPRLTAVVRGVLVDVALREIAAERGRLARSDAERDVDRHDLVAERGAHDTVVERAAHAT